MHRQTVLPSSIAGTWFPGSSAAVRRALEECFADCREVSEDWDAIVVPHAGWAYSGPCAARAYAGIRATKRRVVLLAPSHRFAIRNLAVLPEADAVSTPLGRIEIDGELKDSLLRNDSFLANDDAHRMEHSAQIQYPFLQFRLNDFTLLPVIVGELDSNAAERIAALLSPILADPDCLLVASSDFIHFGIDFDYAPFRSDVERQVRDLNLRAAEFIARRNPDEFDRLIARTGATICGRTAVSLALRSLPETARGEMLRYATSADEDRDFRRFVCYCSIGLQIPRSRKTGDES